MTAALRTALVALVALAVAAPAGAQPTAAPAKAKHCKRGYRLKTVKRKLRRHGHVVRRHGHAVIVKRRVCRKRHHATTTQPPTTLAPAPKVTVALDGVSQGASPTEVTYNASATSDTGPGTLPDGIVNTYQDGLLLCSDNVGGSDDHTACATHTSLGTHTIVLNYLSSDVSATSSTTTTGTTVTANILPFSTTTTASYTHVWHPDGGPYGLRWWVVPSGSVADEHGAALDAKALAYRFVDLTTGETLATVSGGFNLCTEPNGPGNLTIYGGPENGAGAIIAYIPQDHALGMVAIYGGAAGYTSSESQPIPIQTTRAPMPW